MTVPTETRNEDQKTTAWQTLRHWLTAIDEGIHYDPQEHTREFVKHLWQKVEGLEARVNELEGCNQSTVLRSAK